MEFNEGNDFNNAVNERGMMLYISGLWQESEGSWVYSGPDSRGNTIGVAIANANMRSGDIHVSVTFTDVKNSSGRIIIGHSTKTGEYYSVGIGGYAYAFVLDKFSASAGMWKAEIAVGDVLQLQNGKPYLIEVKYRGQAVSLSVDGISVIEQDLLAPLQGSQVGLFAWGNNRIVFEGLQITPSRSQAFVVMKFGSKYDRLYRGVIYAACEKHVKLVRADEIMGPGVIIDDIRRHIIESEIVIAEISPYQARSFCSRSGRGGFNPNVFYELGYAHAYHKNVIILAESGTTLPFDIGANRVIFYEDSQSGHRRLAEHLEKAVQAILPGE